MAKNVFFDEIASGEMYKSFPIFFRYGLCKAPCGYIVTKDLNEDNFHEIDCRIHGGITFDKTLYISKDVISRFNFDIAPGRYRVIGFDMAHYHDIVDETCIRTMLDCYNELTRVIDIVFF